jgi:hypothetical protein
MVPVDVILDVLTSLHFEQYEDAVAELFMDLDRVPLADLQRKLCTVGMPAARALKVKAMLKTPTLASPVIPATVRFFCCYSRSSFGCFPVCGLNGACDFCSCHRLTPPARLLLGLAAHPLCWASLAAHTTCSA